MEFSIGLVFLGVALLLMLFGVFNRLFERMGISVIWAIIAGTALGACFIIPSIITSDLFAFNIGGLIIAGLLSLVLFFSLGFNFRMLRAFLGMLAVAGITILMLFYFPLGALYLRVLFALALGVIVGGAAYMVSGTYKGALYAVIMGILTGQIITFGIENAMYPAFINFGGSYVFDAMITGIILATLTAEIIRLAAGRRTRAAAQTAFSHESGKFHDNKNKTGDFVYHDIEQADYLDDLDDLDGSDFSDD